MDWKIQDLERSFLETTIYMLLGASISGIFSYLFYRKASEDLERMMEKASKQLEEKTYRLERLAGAAVHLIDPERTRYKYDDQGLPIFPVTSSTVVNFESGAHPVLPKKDEEDN